MLDLLTSVEFVNITLGKAARRAAIIYIKHHGGRPQNKYTK